MPSLFRSVGLNWDEIWQWLFYNHSVENAVEVCGKINGRENFAVSLGSTPNRPYSHLPNPMQDSGTLGNVSFQKHGWLDKSIPKATVLSTHPRHPTQDAIDYNRVVVRLKENEVQKLLKQVEPRLQTIRSLQISKEPELYANVGLSEMIPVTQMGEGFSRLLHIYSELVAAQAKVLLIDEIENGLHYSVLPTVWKGLFNAAKEVDGQIFATTHSWECVLAADAAAREEKEYDLNLIRLDRVGDNIKATVIDKDALGTAKELHWEMR